MESVSFTYVAAEGFAAFIHELASGEWASIDTTTYEGPDRTALTALGEAPAMVLAKLQLGWAIADVVEAYEGAGIAKKLDQDWDRTQKKLRVALDAAALDNSEQKREAAARLRKQIVTGSGEGQTRLGYQQEVDFGRRQVQVAATVQGAADVALLGLGDLIEEIRQTTEALAVGIGHGYSASRPSERLRVALVACSAIFGGVAAQLAWIASRGQVGADRTRAAALRVSLEALAARYPAPAEKPADDTDAPAPPPESAPESAPVA